MSESGKKNPPKSLGFLLAAWITAHCVVPAGYDLNRPFRLTGWQLRNAVDFYTIKDGLEFNAARPALGSAFRWRRGQIVGGQKLGKSPFGAAVACFEAVGPCVFCGWAHGGERFRCSDWGCGCGFAYEYRAGEPMGMPRRTALIQLLATSEEQTANVYRPLQTMIRNGRLDDLMKVREGFIRLPNGGRIDPVTSSAKSKLGNPVNFAIMDESGVYTKRSGMFEVADTVARGTAGMDGRVLELTNPWDPMDASFGQATYEARVSDIMKYFPRHDPSLDFMDAADRRRILEFVYRGSPWIQIDQIEAMCEELLQRDPTQARRFFGCELVQGLGSYMPEVLYDATESDREPPEPGTQICLGFDGSQTGDWTALRAETLDGYRWTPTYGPSNRPTFWNPAEWEGRIPRSEVNAAVDELFTKYDVARFYCDPHPWETQVDDWSLRYGGDIVVPWPTNQIGRMYDALTRFLQDTADHTTTHSVDATAKLHMMAARKVAKPGDRYVLGKPSQNQKIDITMADILAHEAAADMRQLGWGQQDDNVYVYGW
ncbi:hypothetical protein [Bifidobacterium pseudolongum]|uniref:Terminase n=1 Tax=Bifidobacterium pseudolongum TaxID=1694 RepID=A0A395XC06_9BIFI|nr:hypothetical protein [Bifidobacterium pseudolongum]RGW07022.1 hypothetical protein DWV92_09400 [Bifidobacterium pseudolongum]